MRTSQVQTPTHKPSLALAPAVHDRHRRTLLRSLAPCHVAGIDAAKEEVQEIVSMLKQPGRYAAAGARLPAGVLMIGPPGTGKTLLARVMAAQAEVRAHTPLPLLSACHGTPAFYLDLTTHLPRVTAPATCHTHTGPLLLLLRIGFRRALRRPRRCSYAITLQGGRVLCPVPHLCRRIRCPRQAGA